MHRIAPHQSDDLDAGQAAESGQVHVDAEAETGDADLERGRSTRILVHTDTRIRIRSVLMIEPVAQRRSRGTDAAERENRATLDRQADGA
jgi:hypothetical protein